MQNQENLYGVVKTKNYNFYDYKIKESLQNFVNVMYSITEFKKEGICVVP